MKPILLATDGSPTSAKAAKIASEFATAFGAPMLVVSVWDVTYEPIGVAYGPVIPDLDHVGHEQAQTVVAAAAAEAREAGVQVETLVRRGSPIQQICAIADEFDPRLIVVGSHGWGAFKRVFFGSVSTGVLHHANQPVLVVRGVAATPAEVADEKLEVSA
jgi:nucleotide-binding universal stress UspA family protein